MRRKISFEKIGGFFGKSEFESQSNDLVKSLNVLAKYVNRGEYSTAAIYWKNVSLDLRDLNKVADKKQSVLISKINKIGEGLAKSSNEAGKLIDDEVKKPLEDIFEIVLKEGWDI